MTARHLALPAALVATVLTLAACNSSSVAHSNPTSAQQTSNAAKRVEFVSAHVTDHGGCAGIGVDAAAHQVEIPIDGAPPGMHCSAMIRMRLIGRNVIVRERYTVQGDAHLLRVLLVSSDGSALMPARAWSGHTVGKTAAPGQIITTPITWRVPGAVGDRHGVGRIVISYHTS